MSVATANTNVLFFGPQGVGKGTQAAVVAPQLRLAHVSTGDLFRQHMAEKTALGSNSSDYDAGGLMPDDLTIAMLASILSICARPSRSCAASSSTASRAPSASRVARYLPSLSGASGGRGRLH